MSFTAAIVIAVAAKLAFTVHERSPVWIGRLEGRFTKYARDHWVADNNDRQALH